MRLALAVQDQTDSCPNDHAAILFRDYARETVRGCDACGLAAAEILRGAGVAAGLSAETSILLAREKVDDVHRQRLAALVLAAQRDRYIESKLSGVLESERIA